MTTISNVAAISAGYKITTAVKSDKSIWQWGTITNVLGSGVNYKAAQLQTVKPAAIPSFTGAAKVSSGYNMLTLVKNEGSVWSMGNNSIGELGDGTRVHRTKPVSVKNLKNIKTTYNIKSESYDYTVTLKNDGTLASWGDNQKGQLGDGTKIRRTAPVAVKNLKSVVSAALSPSHALALTSDGTVWSWGSSGDGALGTGNRTDSLVPVKVKNLTDVKAIAASRSISAALKKDGNLWT